MTITEAQTDAYYAVIANDPPESSCWRCGDPTEPADLVSLDGLDMCEPCAIAETGEAPSPDYWNDL